MSRTNSYSMYGGASGRKTTRNSTRNNASINVRQEWAQALNAGATQPFADAGMVSGPRAGAPAWTNRSPTGATSNYLKEEMASMLDPSLSTSRKQRKSGKRHQQTADVVLDPDDMVHQIFLLKKELLASANEKTQLKTEVRRLDHEVAEIRNMDLMDDNLATKVKNSSLVAGLKKVIRGLRHDLDVAQRGTSELKQGLKYTNIRDLQIEKEVYYEEVLRLQIQIQDADYGDGGEGGGGGMHGMPGASSGDTNYIKPSVQTMRHLKKELDAVKAENAELTGDLDKALTAAFKLKEDLEAPEPTVRGDGSEFAHLSKDELLVKVADLQVKINNVQAENRGMQKKIKSVNAGELGTLERLGLRDDKEPAELRAQIKSLSVKVGQLEAERDESIRFQANLPAPGAPGGGLPASSATPTLPGGYPGGVQVGAGVQYPSAIQLDSQSGPSVAASTIFPHDSASQVGGHPPYRPSSRPPQASSPLRQVLAEDKARATPGSPGSPKPSPKTFEPPTVQKTSMVDGKGGMSGAGSQVEKDRHSAQVRRRKKMMAKNKGLVDEKITVIQKAIRGHVARRRIIEKLQHDQPHATDPGIIAADIEVPRGLDIDSLGYQHGGPLDDMHSAVSSAGAGLPWGGGGDSSLGRHSTGAASTIFPHDSVSQVASRNSLKSTSARSAASSRHSGMDFSSEAESSVADEAPTGGYDTDDDDF